MTDSERLARQAKTARLREQRLSAETSPSKPIAADAETKLPPKKKGKPIQAG
ncbi:MULTISPECIES: hypothetical protein [unclassified Mesorhizobium]|uniref:hypothetical protein n=1 Tax=unclassified Mesorhizobium TaxID=325217 RepID=UPI0033378257